VTKAVNHEYARALGATETIDYETQDVVETVRAAHADGLNAVIDLVGDGELNGRLAELVRTGGNVASMMGAVDVEALAARGITGTNVRAQVTTERLQHLGELVARSTIKRPEIATFPLADAGLALDRVGTHHVRGKLVVVP
jgi:NADPH2:quinone reductase